MCQLVCAAIVLCIQISIVVILFPSEVTSICKANISIFHMWVINGNRWLIKFNSGIHLFKFQKPHSNRGCMYYFLGQSKNKDRSTNRLVSQGLISRRDLSLFWGLNLIESDSWLSLSLFVKSAPGVEHTKMLNILWESNNSPLDKYTILSWKIFTDTLIFRYIRLLRKTTKVWSCPKFSESFFYNTICLVLCVCIKTY